MVCNLRRFIIFVTLLLPSDCLFWTLSSPPAAFGSDVQLFCNGSDFADCCLSKPRRWNGGPAQLTLTLNEKSFFPKYKSTIETNGFSLIIHNFSDSDVNIRYSCSYGFQQYDQVLHLDENFEKYPDMLLYTLDNTQKGLIFTVQFTAVYPQPNCLVDTRNIDLNSTLVTSSTRENLFYNTEIIYNSTLVVQCGVLCVNCTVGSKSFNVIHKTFGECATNEQFRVWIYVVICALLGIAVGAVILVLYWYKEHCTKSKQKKRYDQTVQIQSEMTQMMEVNQPRSNANA